MRIDNKEFFAWLRKQGIKLETKLQIVKDRLEIHEDSVKGVLITAEELEVYNNDLDAIRREAGYYEDMLEHGLVK